MSPLIKKEIRLLLPAWSVAMVLALISPLIYTVSSPYAGSLDFFFRLLFSIAVLLLGISSFGQELNPGLFTVLLSQPVERRRLWNAKIATLIVAFILVWVAAVVSFLVRFHIVSRYDTAGIGPWFWARYRTNTLETLAVSSLVAFSGGLWTTLLLRQVTAAFWLTLLIPAAAFFTISLVANYLPLSDQTIDMIIIAALVVYSIAGFVWARRLFLRAQDVQWTGGEFSLTWGSNATAQSLQRAIQPGRWFSAFAWKEIQLQQINIIIAAVILIFHITSLIIRKIHPHFENQDTQFILDIVWVFWLVLPLLIGSTAVAEERKLGVMESQLCLPFARFAQLFLKFVIGLLLSVFLGGFMPWLIEGPNHVSRFIGPGAAAIFFISFYASTLARTTLQGMGLAIGYMIVVYFLQVADIFDLWRYSALATDIPAGLILLKLGVGAVVLFLVLSALAVWNYKWLAQSGQAWRRNFTAFVAAFVVIYGLSYAFYYRAWEFLTPMQPARGPALFSTSDPKLVSNNNTIYAILPDGRLWTESVAFREITNRWMENYALNPQKCVPRFIAGSNWVNIACNRFQAVGVHADGTLWSLQRKWNPGGSVWSQTGPFIVTQIGADTDWSQAAGEGVGFLLLKKDGTLWTWGANDYEWNSAQISFPKKLKEDLAGLPAPIAGPARYTALISGGSGAFAKKDDGTMWQWISWVEHKFVSTLVAQTNLDGDYASLHYAGGDLVGVKTNGELWLYALVDSPNNKKQQYFIRQVGTGQQWKGAIRADWTTLEALREDGTLWEWSWRPGLISFPQSPPVERGQDYVALANTWDGTFALATDGTLWTWERPSWHFWIAPSRKPVYVTSISATAGQ